MAELTDTLTQLLEGQTPQISRRIGADESKTRSAVQAAVPALLAALSADAQRGSGLRQALDQDHDGSIIDQLSDYLGGTAQLSPRTTNGAGILEHVLGERQGEMQQALSARSGLDMGNIGSLLALLAPILMGMLGKQNRSGGGIDIGDLLNQEQSSNRSKNPDIGDILDSFATKEPTAGRGRSTTAGRSSVGGLADLLGNLFGRRKGR